MKFGKEVFVLGYLILVAIFLGVAFVGVLKLIRKCDFYMNDAYYGLRNWIAAKKGCIFLGSVLVLAEAVVLLMLVINFVI